MREQYEQYRLVWRRIGESDRAAVPLGKVNVELTPNPFAEGCEYTQSGAETCP